jgi:hypothetical protein
MSQDSGLIQRGLVLLALMCILVVVVLSIMFQRPVQATPADDGRPELLVAGLAVPGGSFPATIAWPALYQLGQQLPSAIGWEVRYNAAWALARRGSERVPWKLFREMLDEKRQMRNFRAPLEDGRTVPDEAKARETLLSALRALADWHARQKDAQPPPDEDRNAVYAMVDQLAASPIAQLKIEAEKARGGFIR